MQTNIKASPRLISLLLAITVGKLCFEKCCLAVKFSKFIPTKQLHVLKSASSWPKAMDEEEGIHVVDALKVRQLRKMKIWT